MKMGQNSINVLAINKFSLFRAPRHDETYTTSELGFMMLTTGHKNSRAFSHPQSQASVSFNALNVTN